MISEHAARSLDRSQLLRVLTGRVSEMVESELERFGRLVADRRKALALTLKQLSEAGGPSDVTTGKIERAAIEEPSARTLRRLDAGLRWQSGSAARTLHGGDPISLEELPTASTAIGAGAVSAGPNSVTLPLSVISDLSNVAKEYENVAAQEAVTPDQVAAVNAKFDVLVDRILRSWVIAQLEIKAGPSRDQRDFLVEMLIGDYLDRKPIPASKADEIDLLYMRWLTGRASEEIDPEMDRQFTARWQQAKNKEKKPT